MFCDGTVGNMWKRKSVTSESTENKKIYRAHSCGDQPVSSVTAGVHNVLLQCYIFISVVYVRVYTRVCV